MEPINNDRNLGYLLDYRDRVSINLRVAFSLMRCLRIKVGLRKKLSFHQRKSTVDPKRIQAPQDLNK